MCVGTERVFQTDFFKIKKKQHTIKNETPIENAVKKRIRDRAN
jgi:hypothetical protein